MVEVEIYSGIEFTRFNRTPSSPPPLPFPVKEHMVQINSLPASDCKKKKGRKERAGEGQREQTREEEISGIAVRSEECLHFVPAASHGP